jgi:hypothetical protein
MKESFLYQSFVSLPFVEEGGHGINQEGEFTNALFSDLFSFGCG